MCANYPESKVEMKGFVARHYDRILDVATLRKYDSMIREAIRLMEIKPAERILDLGAGTGRNACLMSKYLSKDGEVVGLDISEEMISQFKENCAGFSNVNVINARVDQALEYEGYFSKVFTSFVLHGFPQEARDRIIGNACRALRQGGEICILDYNEISLKKEPFYSRFVFRMIECPYAFDFIERDWKEILSLRGFGDFEEHVFFRGYVRLLKGKKVSSDCPDASG